MSDIERWRAAAARVSLRSAWQIPIRVRVDEDQGGFMVHVELDAPDIHTGELQTVHSAYCFGSWDRMSDDQMLDIVVRMVRDAVLHELDECLLVDGKQVNDPHHRVSWRSAA